MVKNSIQKYLKYAAVILNYEKIIRLIRQIKIGSKRFFHLIY